MPHSARASALVDPSCWPFDRRVFDHLVAFIAGQPGMADRILRAHVEDGSRHCRVCSTGAQAGRSVWPCTLRWAAEAAKKRAPRA